MSICTPTCLAERPRVLYENDNPNSHLVYPLARGTKGSVWLQEPGHKVCLVDRHGNVVGGTAFEITFEFLCNAQSGQLLDPSTDLERVVTTVQSGHHRYLTCLFLREPTREDEGGRRARAWVKPDLGDFRFVAVSPDAGTVAYTHVHSRRIFRRRLNNLAMEWFPTPADSLEPDDDRIVVAELKIDNAGDVWLSMEWHDAAFYAQHFLWRANSDALVSLEQPRRTPWLRNGHHSSLGLQTSAGAKMRLWTRDSSFFLASGVRTNPFGVVDVCEVDRESGTTKRLDSISAPNDPFLHFWSTVGNAPDWSLLSRWYGCHWFLPTRRRRGVVSLYTTRDNAAGAYSYMEAKLVQSKDSLVCECLSRLAFDAFRSKATRFDLPLPDEELRYIAQGFFDWFSKVQ